MATIPFHASSIGGANRRHELAIVPLGDILAAYQAQIPTWQHHGWMVLLFVNEVLQLTLVGTGTTTEILEAWENISTQRVMLTPDKVAFGQALFTRLNEVWTHPPFNDPDLAIYSAQTHQYIDGDLYIEVQSRALPS